MNNKGPGSFNPYWHCDDNDINFLFFLSLQPAQVTDDFCELKYKAQYPFSPYKAVLVDYSNTEEVNRLRPELYSTVVKSRLRNFYVVLESGRFLSSFVCFYFRFFDFVQSLSKKIFKICYLCKKYPCWMTVLNPIFLKTF